MNREVKISRLEGQRCRELQTAGINSSTSRNKQQEQTAGTNSRNSRNKQQEQTAAPAAGDQWQRN